MDVTTTATAADRLFYPETDRKPMAETDVHINTLIYLREAHLQAVGRGTSAGGGI
jgi:hypothetical protein